MFVEHTCRTNDLAAEQPEIVHVIPNRLLLQSLGDKMDDEWAHRVQYGTSSFTPAHRSGHSRKSGQMSSGVFMSLDNVRHKPTHTTPPPSSELTSGLDGAICGRLGAHVLLDPVFAYVLLKAFTCLAYEHLQLLFRNTSHINSPPLCFFT